ncbi:MAG: phosphoribosyltransferase [Nitrososphaera sp.]
METNGAVKFRDRHEAGRILAERLAREEDTRPALVLGIPRGGVVLADIVAKRMNAEFDIVIPRKLGAPDNEELAIGAVTEDGTAYTNTYLINALRLRPAYVEEEMRRQVQEIKRRYLAYRKQDLSYNIAGKSVILVDDGIATGATVIASARWVRKRNPGSLVIAVPVAPSQSVAVLEQEADSVVAIHTPRDFASVGEFYEEFAPVSDDQVMEIMRARNLL